MAKIPNNAQRVFSGKIYDVYQWQQQLFDGSYTTFECLQRRPTVKVIAVVNDHITLLHEQQPGRKPFIDIPGGRADSYQEAPEDVARRELEEETGLVADDLTLWFVYNNSGKIDWPVYYYVAHCVKKSQPTAEAGEHIEAQYVDFDTFLSTTQQDSFRDFMLAHKILYLLYHNKIDELKKLM